MDIFEKNIGRVLYLPPTQDSSGKLKVYGMIPEPKTVSSDILVVTVGGVFPGVFTQDMAFDGTRLS